VKPCFDTHQFVRAAPQSHVTISGGVSPKAYLFDVMCPSASFTGPQLELLGSKLPMILDHISGNNRDNRPKNLRYLCPNCDSQLSTRGGANRGRVQEAVEGRFVLMQRDGKLHTHVLPEPINVQIKVYPPKVITSKKQ